MKLAPQGAAVTYPTPGSTSGLQFRTEHIWAAVQAASLEEAERPFGPQEAIWRLKRLKEKNCTSS